VSDLFTFSGDRALPGAVLRYRVMVYIVGTALLILTAIVICQYVFDLRSAMKTPEMIVAPIHGYLYIVYLVAAGDLARRARWGLGRILLVVCSGFVPFLAFIIEHRVYRQMQDERAAEATATGTTGLAEADPAPTGVGPTD
jgi:integral membrane protein